MHELAVTESLFQAVLRHAGENRARRVVSVTLRVGEMSTLEGDWLQHYFDYLSRGTVAEGAKIRIERVPVRMKCGACGGTYEVNLRERGDLACPDCGGSQGRIVSGRECHLKEMEVD